MEPPAQPDFDGAGTADTRAHRRRQSRGCPSLRVPERLPAGVACYVRSGSGQFVRDLKDRLVARPLALNTPLTVRYSRDLYSTLRTGSEREAASHWAQADLRDAGFFDTTMRHLALGAAPLPALHPPGHYSHAGREPAGLADRLHSIRSLQVPGLPL